MRDAAGLLQVSDTKVQNDSVQAGRSSHRLIELEAVRGLAATYVVIAHGPLFEVRWIRPFLLLGQEAVIVFFLLSGFVVYYATCGDSRKKPMGFREYFIRRARRIYPIFLLALLLTYLMRSAADNSWSDWHPLNLIGNLFMLQDNAYIKRGVWVNAYLETLAFWSLSYEWWFYMGFFPVMRRISPLRQLYWVCGLSVAGFMTYQFWPNQASLFLAYFAIWWMGVELAREYTAAGEVTWQRQGRSIAAMGGIALLWTLPIVRATLNHQALLLGVDPVLQFRHFAATVVVIAVAVAYFRRPIAGAAGVFRLFASVAPISYAMYVFHAPIYKYTGVLLPPMSYAAHFVVTILMIVILSWLAEVTFQRQINCLTDRVLLHRSPRARPLSDTLTPP